ncbi:MAG: hypothetical protein OEY26_09340 [Nitrospinota bacterium]|jgi:hypothetical protein|nr:hypothetical protein [Nitrospinota bacterium]
MFCRELCAPVVCSTQEIDSKYIMAGKDLPQQFWQVLQRTDRKTQRDGVVLAGHFYLRNHPALTLFKVWS